MRTKQAQQFLIIALVPAEKITFVAFGAGNTRWLEDLLLEQLNTMEDFTKLKKVVFTASRRSNHNTSLMRRGGKTSWLRSQGDTEHFMF